MTAKIYTGQLRPGRFGIPEPPEGAPTIEDPEWAVVPGIAFDRDGFRLGRGGGYYDRWLLGRTIRTVGLCRPERLVPELPRDPWDIPVQTVITGVD
jgi:5-formyltetrahydrofolate cyclo-ligase